MTAPEGIEENICCRKRKIPEACKITGSFESHVLILKITAFDVTHIKSALLNYLRFMTSHQKVVGAGV